MPPADPTIDEILFDVVHLKIKLTWAQEHYATLKANIHSPELLDNEEFKNLGACIEESAIQLRVLANALLAGKTIDPLKKVPREISLGWPGEVR